jgi:5-methylcytosine-specific restriction endonuclease McrA
MMQQCLLPPKGCGQIRDVEEFRISRRGATPTLFRKAVCKICEVRLRLEAKERDPYRHAFLLRRRSHASRWGYSVQQLKDFGWDDILRPAEMKVQFEHCYCPDCPEVIGGKPVLYFYRDMTHGLEDLSIDRIRYDEPPHWPANIRWLCKTCNARQHDKPKSQHAQRILAVREFRQSEHLFATDPFTATYTEDMLL